MESLTRSEYTGELVAMRLPVSRIQLDQFDSTPERTERQPETAVGILRNRRINGVEIIGVGGLNDDALVGPLEPGIGGVQRGIDRQADGRSGFYQRTRPSNRADSGCRGE